MNKTYLVAGGASIASLAAGAAGGFFFAKKKLGKEFDERLAREVLETKKHFALQLAEARSGKPDSPLDLAITEKPEEGPLEETPAEKIVRENAEKALTDYQGISKTNGSGSDLIEKNVFDKRPNLPPRGPGGKFLPRQAAVPEDSTPDPYLIDEDDFLQNDPEHDQENLKWYPKEGILLMATDEEVEIEQVGKENLTQFPEVDPGTPCIIFVRNEKTKKDWEIQRMGVDLTEEMGLDNGDLEHGDPDLEYALNQD